MISSFEAAQAATPAPTSADGDCSWPSHEYNPLNGDLVVTASDEEVATYISCLSERCQDAPDALTSVGLYIAVGYPCGQMTQAHCTEVVADWMRVPIGTTYGDLCPLLCGTCQATSLLSNPKASFLAPAQDPQRLHVLDRLGLSEPKHQQLDTARGFGEIPDHRFIFS